MDHFSVAVLHLLELVDDFSGTLDLGGESLEGAFDELLASFEELLDVDFVSVGVHDVLRLSGRGLQLLADLSNLRKGQTSVDFSLHDRFILEQDL